MEKPLTVQEVLKQYSSQFSPQIMNDDECGECRINFKDLEHFISASISQILESLRMEEKIDQMEWGNGYSQAVEEINQKIDQVIQSK